MQVSKRIQSSTGTDGKRSPGDRSPEWWKRTYIRAWRIVSYRWTIIWHRAHGEAGAKQARVTTFAQVVHEAVANEERRCLAELKRLGIDPASVKQVKATPRRPVPPIYTPEEMAARPAPSEPDRYAVDPPVVD